MLEGMSEGVEVIWATKGGKNVPEKSMSRCPIAKGSVGKRRNSKLGQCGWYGKNRNTV